MSEWYDAAPPDIEEVVKKEFGTLIEDDPEWKVVGTIAKEDVIAQWAGEMPIKLQQSKTVSIPFDPIPMGGWTLSGLAKMQAEKWASNKGTLAKYWGWDLPDDPFDSAPWLNAVPSAPWVIHDEANDIYTTYATGGLAVGPEPRTPLPHQCHCLRDRHLAPLRQRVADMLSSHTFDASYDASEDISPIVCVGSETYGPNRGPTDVVRREVSYGYGISVSPGCTYATDMEKKWADKQKSWTGLSSKWLSVLNDENLTITYKAITGIEEQE